MVKDTQSEQDKELYSFEIKTTKEVEEVVVGKNEKD